MVLVLLILMGLPGRIFAQVTGTITGTVTDETGAVVPDATITITNMNTGVVTRTLQTTSAGVYVAEALPVGTYSVNVRAQGFQSATQSNIALNVADRLAVNFALKVGQITQHIEVTALPPVVETESGEQSQIVSTRQITEIPILGRNFLLLQQLVPGASRTAGDEMGKSFYASRGYAINGLNETKTGYQLDGVQNTDMGNQSSTLTNPGPDVLAEFKVLTSNYSAKYGVAGGANILAVTKAGTKEFHGDVWEFVRNDKFSANNFFLNRAGAPKAPLRYNDYGYTIGGPLYIPNHYNTDKSKTFFFWSQNWIKQRTASPVNAATPTEAMRQGDFTGFGPLKNPTDPATGQPMTDAQGNPCVGGVNMDRINPNCINHNVALLFQQDFPLPTPGLTGFYNFLQGASSSQDWREDFIRVDQNISPKVRAFVRFIHDGWEEADPVVQWSGDSFPTVHSIFNVPSRNLIAKLTTTISPTLLNEISYTYGSNYGSGKPPAMNILGAATKPPGYDVTPVFGENPHNLIPDMSFSGGWGGISTLWGPWWAHHNISQLSDDLMKQAGSHSFSVGATGMFSITPVDSQVSCAQGCYNFDGSFTNNPIADALLGRPIQYQEFRGRRTPTYNYHQFEAYVQDDWKVSKRLTLNLGVRYFYIPHVYSDVLSTFWPTSFSPSAAPTVNPDGTITPDTGNLLNGIVIAGKGVPRGFVPNYHDNFGPRFGFAFDPKGDGKTAIRGGYGVGYYRIEGNDVYRMVGNPPFSELATFFSPPFDNPAAGVAAPLTPLAVNGLDPIYKIPMAQNWSFSVQRELTDNTRLSVAYVGSRGTHLDMVADINQPLPVQGYDFDPRIACTQSTPFPCNSRVSTDYVRPYQGWSSISNIIPVGSSIYHSLQLSFEKRYGHGLTLGSVYTWSKAISTSGGGGLGATPQNFYNLAAERGLAGFDRTHIWVTNYVYDIPLFQNLKGASGVLLKGWESSGIITIQSGFALDPGFTSATQGLANRPDRLGGSIEGPKTVDQWFNTGAFAAPAFGHFGNAARGDIRGPGQVQFDLGLFKNFALGERVKLQFRSEWFNAFNHTNFNAVDTRLGSGGFGQLTSSHNARNIQFALKLIF
jgi:hypothetical protein